eukprot:scaffold111146_cov27-Phaeocystis_antarctica.AAC.1
MASEGVCLDEGGRRSQQCAVVLATVAAGAPSQQLQLLASDALMTQLVAWLHSPADQLREEAFAALDNLGPAARQLFGLEPAELGPEGDGVCAEAPRWA